MIVHNQNGNSDVGLLTNRTTDRMIQVGEDQDGNPIFKIDTNEDNNPIEDTFLSLEGIGLPSGTGIDTVRYFGVEIDGIENLEIRLSNGNDLFIVAEVENHKYEDSADIISMDGGEDLPGDVNLTIAAGDGDDTVNIEQVIGLTTILGGAGNDIVNVSDEGSLVNIASWVIFYGDAHIHEDVDWLTPAEHAALLGMDMAEYNDLLANVPNTFINSEPSGNLFYPGPGNTTVEYEEPELAPIMYEDGGYIFVYAVVIDEYGAIVEDLVHEYGVWEQGVYKTEDDQPVYLDENGEETLEYADGRARVVITVTDGSGQGVYLDEEGRRTLENTGVKSIITDFENGTPLYVDLNGNRTFTDTGIPAVIPVCRTEPLHYTVAIDYRLSYSGDYDTLNVNGSADQGDTQSVLDTYELGEDQFDVSGTPEYYNENFDPLSPVYWVPAKRFNELLDYTGTEPLRAGQPVVDAGFNIVTDGDGNVVFHDATTIRDVNGDPIFHNPGEPVYELSGDVQYYFGGEQKTDPVTLELLFYTDDPQTDPYTNEAYQAGDVVINPFTGEIVRDTSGNPVLHESGDPLVHMAGDGVLRFAGEIVRYFGGEQVYDEEGNVVYNGDGSRFTHLAGEALIHNRREPILDAGGGHLAYTEAAPRYYFGDEAVEIDQPVTDSYGNITLDDDGNVLLYTADTIIDEDGNPVLHNRGKPVYELLSGEDKYLPESWVQATYAAGELRYYLGNEPVVYFGGETAYYTNSDQIQTDHLFNRITVDGVSQETDSGMNGAVYYDGVELVVLTTGPGEDLVDIRSTMTAETIINTKGGEDEIYVRTVSGPTTVNSGTGNDAVVVTDVVVDGNENKFPWVDDINALLTINGGGGTDSTFVNDSGDTNNNTGVLTATTLTGLDMAAGIVYGTLEEFDMALGTGDDTFHILSIADNTDTFVNTNSGDDTVNIGNEVHTSPGLPYGNVLVDIDFSVSINASGGSDKIRIDNSGADDTGGQTGILTATSLTGFSMSGTITYDEAEMLEIWLGSCDDDLFVESTHVFSTILYTLEGDDGININSISGKTDIFAGYGDDTLRINYDQEGNQTDQSGIDGVLTLHGERGGDKYLVGLGGEGSSVINVYDLSPADDLGIDALDIFGTADADYFLMRPNMVAGIELNEYRKPVEDGFVERVNYGGDINSNVRIFGRTGDDTFVFDDNSASMVAYGDAGDDVFQIGQVFKSPRDANAGLSEEDWFETTLTTKGYLSNGISYSTTPVWRYWKRRVHGLFKQSRALPLW